MICQSVCVGCSPSPFQIAIFSILLWIPGTNFQPWYDKAPVSGWVPPTERPSKRWEEGGAWDQEISSLSFFPQRILSAAGSTEGTSAPKGLTQSDFIEFWARSHLCALPGDRWWHVRCYCLCITALPFVKNVYQIILLWVFCQITISDRNDTGMQDSWFLVENLSFTLI